MRQCKQRRMFICSSLALVAGLGARPARACEYITSHLRITHPWTRATEQGADTAVLGMRFDEVTQTDRLIGVRTPVAMGAVFAGAEPGTPLDVEILRGSVVELGHSGPQLRLIGLTVPLQVGRAYPLELHFAESGVVLAQLTVDFPALRFG
jgi:copper(I)-binding protein